jgi:hypothetical protein
MRGLGVTGGALVVLGALWSCGGDDQPGSPGQVSGGASGSGTGGSGIGGDSGSSAEAGSAGTTSSAGRGGGGDGNGGVGGDGLPAPMALYVDAESGDDANPGTQAAPLRTIAHALTRVGNNDVVYLLPGTFSPSSEPAFSAGFASVLEVPPGVTITAVTPATVTLDNGDSGGFSFLGAGSLKSVTLIDFAPAIAANAGSLVLEDLVFDYYAGTGSSCGTAGDRAFIELHGDAEATLNAGATAAALGDSAECFARLQGGAALTVSGVDLSGALYSADAALFTVIGNASLTLDGVTIAGALEPIVAREQATVIVENASVIDASGIDYGARLSGNAAFTLSGGSTLSGASSACVRGESDGGTPTIAVIDSTLSYCARGLWHPVDSAPNIELDGATISNMVFEGILMGHGGSLTVTASTLSGNGESAISTTNSAEPVNATIRDSVFSDNSSAGVRVSSHFNSTWDLGRGNDPGGNTFTGNEEGGVALYLGGPQDTLVIHASGNTWMPNVQDADGDGHYSVVSGEANDVVEGYGDNYWVFNQWGVLRLAEKP